MNVVIIRAAGHVELVLGAAQSDPSIRIAGIAPGPAGEHITRFYRSHFPGRTVAYYPDYLAMLDERRLDIAVVCSYFTYHSDVILECLRRGVHVFCEKPIATSLQALDAIRKTLDKGSVQLSAMHTYRYSPPFIEACRAVENGLIGEPLLFTAQKSYKLGIRPEFYRSRNTYGGTILWVGIHAVDWLYWCTGGGIAEISAQQTTRGNRVHGELESSATCFYRLRNSGSASISIDFFRPGTAGSHGDDRLRVAGEKGIVEVKNERATVITADAPEIDLECGTTVGIFTSFVRQIQGKERMLFSASDVFAVTELAIITQRAADEARPILWRDA